MENKKEIEKLEALKTTELKKWIEATLNSLEAGPAEVKVERGSKFYYSSGSFPKELMNLMKATVSTTAYKNPDTGFGTPYDLCIYSCSPAWLFIFFGDVKKFYMIDIRKIYEDIDAGSKGLTEQKANELAYKVDFIK